MCARAQTQGITDEGPHAIGRSPREVWRPGAPTTRAKQGRGELRPPGPAHRALRGAGPFVLMCDA
jgi:hypothetical protein